MIYDMNFNLISYSNDHNVDLRYANQNFKIKDLSMTH